MAYLTRFYDQYNLPQKNQVVLDAELSLIQALCAPPAKVLDIGCGTGRHLIPLIALGYQATGVDINVEMIDQLKEKSATASAFVADITKPLPAEIEQEKYDLIIMMWNTFNEWALTEQLAIAGLRNCQQLLTPQGKILINTEDAEKINPQQFNFVTNAEVADVSYRLESRLLNWAEQSRISTTQEIVKVENSGVEVSGEVVQRWWSRAEIKAIAKQADLDLTDAFTIPVNQEQYLLLMPMSVIAIA